jgi:iron complex transport system substrate-binding protein
VNRSVCSHFRQGAQHCLRSIRWALCLAVFFQAGSALAGPVTVVDDTGAQVTLVSVPQRIVSLVPHATELLFAAGAGKQVVAVDISSDYPPAAIDLPKLGGLNTDLEALAALRPDLVVAWSSSSPPWLVQRLRSMGIPVYMSALHRLDDIPGSIERLGMLAGTQTKADAYAAAWRMRLDALRRSVRGKKRLPVFYQILDNSLLTVTGQHMISDVIDSCGGSNMFGRGPGLTLRLDLEVVLHKDPPVILAAGFESFWSDWRERWRTHKLHAARADNLFFFPPELLHRTGPRMLEGAERVCAAIAQARTRLP